MAPPNAIPKTPIPTRGGLNPIFVVPPVRQHIPVPPITPGRPSVNLGHALNSSSIQTGAHLFPHVNPSNPLPFHMLNPQSNPLSQHYGSRVSAAVGALQRPNFSDHSRAKPAVNFGQRVKAAIRAVTRS